MSLELTFCRFGIPSGVPRGTPWRAFGDCLILWGAQEPKKERFDEGLFGSPGFHADFVYFLGGLDTRKQGFRVREVAKTTFSTEAEKDIDFISI